MNQKKILVYLITVLATSIVVFNSFTDLVSKVFNPVFNLKLFGGFGAIVISSVWYVVYNWRDNNV